MASDDNGNIALGFLLGMFCGCIGLAIAALAGKPDTRKGAVIGFVVQVVLGVAGGGVYSFVISP